MTPHHLLARIHAAGIMLWSEAEMLRYRAPKGVMTAELLMQIRTHKETLLALLERFEERAAIMEYGAGLPRADAERQAWQVVLEHSDAGATLEAGSDAQPAAAYLTKPHLSPDLVKIAFRHYVAAEHGRQLPDLPEEALLSEFNAWRQARGLRPTTLPVLCQAMGMPTARGENPPAYVKRCPKCGGTNWGSSRRHTADGAEIWCCQTCARRAKASQGGGPGDGHQRSPARLSESMATRSH
jgi:hypothetical protein